MADKRRTQLSRRQGNIHGNGYFNGRASAPEKTAFSVILAVSFCHMLNDIMQSLLTALYPLLKANYALDFVQIGLLTFTFQVTASMLQPAVGIVHRPLGRCPIRCRSAMLSTLRRA